MTRSAISALSAVRRGLLPGRALLDAREVDELVGDEPVTHGERHLALPVGEHEHEALGRPTAVGTSEREVDRVAATRNRTEHELERVARARPSERGANHDLAPLGCAVRRQQRQRALEHLVGVRHATRRARPVVAHQVFEENSSRRPWSATARQLIEIARAWRPPA